MFLKRRSGIPNLRGSIMRQHYSQACREQSLVRSWKFAVVIFGVLVWPVTSFGQITLLDENFDSLPLGPFVSPTEFSGRDVDWTATAPAGWISDPLGTPAGNPVEFFGFTFLDKQSWVTTSRNERRSLFGNATGTVLVADPDEYDDGTNVDPNLFNAAISTPVVDASGVLKDTLRLQFDSSFRPADDQTGSIEVSFDGGNNFVVAETLDTASSRGRDSISRINERISLDLGSLPNSGDGDDVQVRFALSEAGNDRWWAIDNVKIEGFAQVPAAARSQAVLFQEDFEDTPLGSPVDEPFPNGASTPVEAVWTDRGPTNWLVDNTQMPAQASSPGSGVAEWNGWSFADKDWWISVDNQGRGDFAFGSGTVAVADPDEWDDISRTPGEFNSFLTTPEIALRGEAATLELDSSFRPFAQQTATIDVSFDGGRTFTNLLTKVGGDSVSQRNEQLSLPLNNAADDASAILRFGLTQAGNDWWWAVDNIALSDGGGSLFVEDFESLPLGPNIQEGNPSRSDVWSPSTPGWSVDNSQLGDGGVTEWQGWSFAEGAWWKDVARSGGISPRNREFFAGSQGTVAIADPREWTDLATSGAFNSFLVSPEIDISQALAGTLALQFDSSWRASGNQTATVEVSYDGGQSWEEILRWESPQDSPFFHLDNENEQVFLSLAHPAEVASMMLRFGLTDAGRNWWWAVDNIVVTAELASTNAIPEPTSLALWFALGLAGLSSRTGRRC